LLIYWIRFHFGLITLFAHGYIAVVFDFSLLITLAEREKQFKWRWRWWRWWWWDESNKLLSLRLDTSNSPALNGPSHRHNNMYVGAQSFEIKSLARDSPTLTRRSHYQTRTAKKKERKRERENGNLDRNICAKRHVYKRIRPSVAAGRAGNTTTTTICELFTDNWAPAGQEKSGQPAHYSSHPPRKKK
jgi:hypothetical protein